VPNFSEGRNEETVGALAEAVESVAGVALLDRTMDPDHHRSVLTFAGAPADVEEAALRAVGKAIALIDLTRHRGVHPRIGAADVVPFVPVRGVTLAGCAGLAEKFGHALWERFRLPVYLYEASARRPERRRLENIRRGGFEALREAVSDTAERHPDIGGPALHPTAGAAVTGARKFLIAYNIDLATPDLGVAKHIARTVRESSGGLACVKAMGVPLDSRGLAQVSMNLTDFETTSIARVYGAVKAEAARMGVAIAGGELIGLIPRAAVDENAEWFTTLQNFRPDCVLETALERALARRGVR
jgi:glutamate formiminotransferase